MSSEAIHSWSAAAIDDAQRAEYVAFLHREPFVVSAYTLGFTVGVREDYSYQSSLRNVDVPIEMLDNDFRNPDLDRYIERFEAYEPSIGVLGDAYDAEEAREYNRAARELSSKFPGTEIIVVPKCRKAIDVIDQDIMLGYPMGYSDMTAEEYTNIVDWRNSGTDGPRVRRRRPSCEWARPRGCNRRQVRERPDARVSVQARTGPNRVPRGADASRRPLLVSCRRIL